jgi:hypothetical protein
MHPRVRVVLWLSAALAVSTPVLAGGHAPVGAPVRTTFIPADGRVDSLDAARAMIVAAGQRHGWAVAKDAPGLLTLRLVVRGKHVVVVDVAYDTTTSRITYVSSENMDYEVRHGVPTLHSSYTRWVTLLAQSIETCSRGL